jgi:CHAT domain-containing protein
MTSSCTLPYLRIAICALAVLLSATAAAANLLESGDVDFARGAFESAVTRWEEAGRAYAAQGNIAGQIEALNRIGRAQSELGQYRRAVSSFTAALDRARGSGNVTLAATALTGLGSAQLALGDTSAAERTLREAASTARGLSDPALAAAALNQLGSLLLSQGLPAEAAAQYDESAALAPQRLLRARARVNAATALREGGRAEEALQRLNAARSDLEGLTPSHEMAFTMVSAGLGYRDLRPYRKENRRALTLDAHAALLQAGNAADAIRDHKVASYAWGYLGQLYEEEKRFDAALTLTRRAVYAAQQTNAPESLYLWQWQAGRLLRQLGQVEPAIDSYRRAVATLQSVRPELSMRGTAPDAFRQKVGPIYFELVDLLLQRSRAASAGTPSATLLVEARETIELFKVAELRDYFRDDCVDTALSKATRLDELARTAAVIYPIVLSDRLELLLSLPTGLKSVAVKVDGAALAEEVRQFRRKLEKRTTREYLPHARQLYQWLIAPIARDLTDSGADTLVFVPDGPLRTIPMAALHDGTNFLIARYATAITPGLSLTDPRPIRRERAKVLAAGLSEPVQGFAPLPGVSEELRGLSLMFDTTTLENRDFVIARLQKNLAQERYSVVHVASHGEFSGDPAKSFLLTYDGRLGMDRLGEVIGLFKYREEPLELLTLSACETAAGDDRAALGLAGVAVRAGARSALATYWQVHDAVSADLMGAFYSQLRNSEVSRAVALQRAQLHVLENPRFTHPGYWSPYLLINSWL